MPCEDSSASMSIYLDPEERFVGFDFVKITCGRKVTAQTGYQEYCRGRTLTEILGLTFDEVRKDLNPPDDEVQFILFLEWDCLRCAIAQYLGIHGEDLDTERCLVSSIHHDDKGIEIAHVVLPPKEMPQIIPCQFLDNR